MIHFCCSLGIDHRSFINGNLQRETLHLWSIDRITLENVWKYFEKYSPQDVQIINGNECKYLEL